MVRAVWQAAASHPVVESVILGGSRADGRATDLSDWDLYLHGDPDLVMAAIPKLVAPLRPLAAFWEPLAQEAGYMTVMTGPVKVDLFPVGAYRPLQPPWQPQPESLAAIDQHFWDWLLWLGSKSLRAETELVVEELKKMHWFLLGPMGAEQAPMSLQDAASSYLAVRTEVSARLGVRADEELGRQVIDALGGHRLVAADS